MKPNFLSAEELRSVLETFPEGQLVTVDRIRYKNITEIRTPETVPRNQLIETLLSCMESGHQSGGDIEIALPHLNQTLVGHHDGLYWLEDLARTT